MTIPASTATDDEQSGNAHSEPLKKKARIVFLDSIRGIALLGILVMNSMAQGQNFIFYDKLNLKQPITGPNLWVWIAERGVFEGTMRGIFSILFGAGTFLLISRLEKRNAGLEPADIYFRRMLWLLAFGLINAFVFLWPGDILYPYALCGMLLFPFRNLSVKNLLLVALFLIAFGTFRENRALFAKKDTIELGKIAESKQLKKQKLTDEQKGDLQKWKKFKEEHSSAGYMKKAEEETKEIRKSNYAEIFANYRDVNMEIQSIGFYNWWWDMMIFFLIGIALLKSGYLEGNSALTWYWLIAIIGISIGLVLNYFQLKTEYDNKFDDVILTQTLPFNYYQIRRVIQTLGYLSLFILLYKAVPFRKIMNIFAPVGQLAFTNYLMQSIITSLIFYGLGWFGELQRYQIYYIVLGIWVFQIIFSHVWLRYFYFGPFEWLWRSLTYLIKPPFLRRNTENS